MGCLDANQVIDYLDGAPMAPAGVEHHLASCDSCRVLVAAMARGSSPGGAADAGVDAGAGTAAGAAVGAGAAAPDQIGRFAIEELIGRGGMGLVFRAWDPQLERHVAVKRVRGGGGDDGAAATARARLLREARALAQLAHPHVVAIHDVGVHDGDVYLAMEHVPGPTLRGWLEQAPPPTAAEVQAALLAIGRGLAAAHAAGLVHRDVKPDNVIVGDDGRVRVVDFGLVAPSGEARGGGGDGAALAAGSELTATGAAVGTPAFMSPEQRAGTAADAASDQWSFAMTACQALTGRRAELGDGTVVLPDRLSPRVRPALARALAIDPAARFPSMAALLVALERGFSPPRRRGPFLAAGAGLAIVVGVAAFVAWPADDVAGCDARASLAGVWDADVARRVRDNVAVGGDAATTRVVATLDRHAAAWSAQRRDLCRDDAAGRGRAEERAARGRCLARTRAELATFTRVLGGGPVDRAHLSAALDAAARLPAAGACADGASLALAERGVPVDAAGAAREVALGEIGALVALGQSAEAQARGRELIAEATAAGDDRRAARAWYQLGAALNHDGRTAEAEAAVRESIRLAARAGDDATLADGWVGLLGFGGELFRFDEARALLPVAEAAVVRAGEEPRRVLDLLEADCSVAGWTQDYAPTLERHARLFAPAAAALGDDDVFVIGAAVSCAEVLLAVDRDDEAEALAARALAGAERGLDPHHDSYLDALRVMALVRLAQDRPADARALLAPVAAWADALDPAHPYRYYAHFSTGVAWSEEEHLVEAHVDEAIRELELARAAVDARGDARDLRYHIVNERLAELVWARGDLAQAEALWTDAVARRRALPGQELLGQALSGLGAVAAARGDLAAARAALEEAVIVTGATGEQDAAWIGARVRLARLVWSIDRARALALVREVGADRIVALPPLPPLPPDARPLQAWLRDVCAAHGCAASTP